MEEETLPIASRIWFALGHTTRKHLLDSREGLLRVFFFCSDPFNAQEARSTWWCRKQLRPSNHRRSSAPMKHPSEGKKKKKTTELVNSRVSNKQQRKETLSIPTRHSSDQQFKVRLISNLPTNRCQPKQTVEKRGVVLRVLLASTVCTVWFRDWVFL